MVLISIILLMLSTAAYSCGQLQQHGKLKWSNEGVSFWGKSSDLKKYKWDFVPVDAPNNWYYRFFKIEYKERFPLSATLLVMFTDGYHLMQFLSHLLLSISFGLQFQINWFDFNGHVQAMVVTWILVKATHFFAYKFLQR